MLALTVFGALLLAALAGVAVFGRPFGGVVRGICAGCAVLIVVMLLGASFTTVDARAIGIQTSFGKYRDTLGSGVHLVAPWSDVEQWTTRNQTLRLAGDGKAGERDNYVTEPHVTVRLGTQSEAYVDATVTWSITEKSAENLWRQYKTFDDARRDYVAPAALAAVVAAFDGYDPFRGIAAGTEQSVSVEQWATRVTDKLRPVYDQRGVHLIGVQVTRVSYDQRTEDKLRQYADAVANTRIATQDVETAKQQAAASAARATQSAPGCEALIRDLAAQDKLKDLPQGWQCPGTSAGGVIVGPRQ